MSRHSSGWIKLYRSAWESDLGSNPYLFALFGTLLCMATREESSLQCKGQQRRIPPGTAVFGIREIAQRWNCSVSTISRWLHYLHRSERINLETGTLGCIATIRNWRVYQNVEQIGEHKRNTRRTPREQEENLNGEVKKEELRINTVQRKRRTTLSPFDLEAAYQRYPRKEGKSRGLQALTQQIKTPEDYQSLLEAVSKYSDHCKGKDPKYTKVFSTFVSEWRDWTAPDAGTVTPLAGSAPKELHSDLKTISPEESTYAS